MKPILLLVVNPQRVDFFQYLKNLTDYYTLAILWRIKNDDTLNLPSYISEEYFWTDFLTPLHIIDKVKPSKIVFFEIIDLRQISLLVACKYRKVRTFYLEHGAAGDKNTAIQRWEEKSHLDKRPSYLYTRLTKHTKDLFKSKLFYYSALGCLKGFASHSSYLSLPFRMLRALPNKVLSKHHCKERVPDYAITFNEANFEEFELYTGIERSKVLFTGVPFFDDYFRSVYREENYVVYIDSPFFEERLLGWTSEHHKSVAGALASFTKKYNLKVVIKLHPRSDKRLWESYGLDPTRFEILQEGNFTEVYLNAKLILGYSSSLITGLLCARKNIVILNWNPVPMAFGADFSATGLCHSSIEMSDLTSKFSFWIQNNKCLQETSQYETFLRRFNWPFDGQATNRVIAAIRDL